MHVGNTISAMFFEQGKTNVDFARCKYKQILAVHRQLEKPHLNTRLIQEYAYFLGCTVSIIIARAENFGVKIMEADE